MKLDRHKFIPAAIAAAVIAIVAILSGIRWELFERFEFITYDRRVQISNHFSHPAATNLGCVFIDDKTVEKISDGLLGKNKKYGLFWPRLVYGRVLRELAAQNAKAVAFDVLFNQYRTDPPEFVANAKWPGIVDFLKGVHPGEEPFVYENAGEKVTTVESDDFLAWQLKRAGMALVAAENSARPEDLFITNAAGLGDISSYTDYDGVLRRAKAFRVYLKDWHPYFIAAQEQLGYDLKDAQLEARRVVLPHFPKDPNPIVFDLDQDGNFELTDFVAQVPEGQPPKARACTAERVWHMGVVMAARELGLDLDHADVDLKHGKITLRGPNDIRRVIPVDKDGFFYINWELPLSDGRVEKEAFHTLLQQDLDRTDGAVGNLTNRWQHKLIIIGSGATGNNMADVGSTPLEKYTHLVSKHWNVANSIITDRFVRRSSLSMELFIIVLLGSLTALMSLKLRAFVAFGGIVVMGAVYTVFAAIVFVQQRYWLPLILPISGCMAANYAILFTYRVVFEQQQKRRVKSVFSKIVSPDVVNELLNAEKLSSLSGTRREVSILFADVRGFTELTDLTQERAADYVRTHKLTREQAEKCFDEVAGETLNTVNLYLACVADAVKKHNGTLDKYIGDCVMAFWGAPNHMPNHAVACALAAIDAQRGMFELNKQRAAENKRREVENQERAVAGLIPRPPLPTLTLGTGINTGLVTVGLMGSDSHILNYTVFGREVNLASRLESHSGRGRIVISESTYRQILRDDPALAATCIPLPPATGLKGFRTAVEIYEVPWLQPGDVLDMGQTGFFTETSFMKEKRSDTTPPH